MNSFRRSCPRSRTRVPGWSLSLSQTWLNQTAVISSLSSATRAWTIASRREGLLCRLPVAGFDLGNVGAVNIYKYGFHGIFNYLPLLAPLPGTRLVDVATVPNAFALTNTPIARSMRQSLMECSSSGREPRQRTYDLGGATP